MNRRVSIARVRELRNQIANEGSEELPGYRDSKIKISTDSTKSNGQNQNCDMQKPTPPSNTGSI